MLNVKGFNSITTHKYLVMSTCPGQSFTQSATDLKKSLHSSKKWESQDLMIKEMVQEFKELELIT